MSENRTVASAGPGPFITRREFRGSGGPPSVWFPRAHRKRLRAERADWIEAIGRRDLAGLADARGLNWWIATLFAIRSCMFAWASFRALLPFPDPLGGATSFAGSIFFTAAAVQLYQAVDSGPPAPQGSARPFKGRLFGWNPRDIGWLACVTLFAGTLLFNRNTFEAMRTGLDPARQDLLVWSPDFVGSALCSWVPLEGGSTHVPAALAFTCLGALCFLAGSLLLYPESADA